MILKQCLTVLPRKPETQRLFTQSFVFVAPAGMAARCLGAFCLILFVGALIPLVQSAEASQDTPVDLSLKQESASTALDVKLERQWKSAIANDDVGLLEQMWVGSDRSARLLAVRSDNGKNALMIASKTGDHSFFETLLSAGEDPEATTLSGGTPLMFATLGNHEALVRRLVALDVDIDAQGSNGWSSMTIAAAKGFTGLVSYLASVGADVNVTDVYGWTPIMRAVDNRHEDTVVLLSGLAAIDLDNQDEAGNTALHHAVVHQQIDVVRVLIEQGASTTVENYAGQSPRQLAMAGPGSDEFRSLFSD